MTTLRPLTANDFDALVAAFVEAFSDYSVPMAMTPEAMRSIIARRGVDFGASIGAFDGQRMVGFTINGIDGDRGYDSGTGVVPSHRRTGLGRQIMDTSIAVLRARGIRNYQLEVLDGNRNAIALYGALGFRETRALQCWTYSSAAETVMRESPDVDLETLASWCDVAPSWQNSVASIRRAIEPHMILGNSDAAIILYPQSGDVPLFAVRPTHRRRGLGRQLLAAAAARSVRPLRILNIDERAHGIASFLAAAGATKLVRQLEMLRPLD